MAPKPVLLLLWDLTLLIHAVWSFNVTCWTDYNTALNCSCSNFEPTFPVSIQVHCRNEELNKAFNASCQIKPSESGCDMYPEEFDQMADTDTYCNASALRHDPQEILYSDSFRWKLCDVVPAQPPLNIQVTNSDGFYNITWDSNHSEHLVYRVRIRDSKDVSKAPVYSKNSLHMTCTLLDHSKLQPNVRYFVDVKAKWSGHPYLEGPWSQWSSTSEWTTRGTSRDTKGRVGTNGYFWYFTIPAILFIMLLGYSQKPFWQKKLQLITIVPNPNGFFDALYNIYEGNFKAWVNPVFSEYDFLSMNTDVVVINEKPQDLLHLKKTQTSKEHSGCFFHNLEPMANPLLPLQDRGSSQDTGHSTGHSCGHSTEHSTGTSSERSTRHSTGHSTGNSSEDSARHSTVHSPGNSSEHSSGNSSGNSTGHSSEHCTRHSGGHSTGHSTGHCNRHSSGHSSGHSCGHSMGHSTRLVSIHTVKLCGQEAEGQEVESQSSVNSLQDVDSFDPYAEDNKAHGRYDLDKVLMAGQRDENENLVSVGLSLENPNFEPDFNEAERMSLDSFVSNGLSEDGYPHVDLDTIDSGFGECSSPAATDADTEQHRHSPLFHQNTTMHSNYVKQWMAGSTVQDEYN